MNVVPTASVRLVLTVAGQLALDNGGASRARLDPAKHMGLSLWPWRCIGRDLRRQIRWGEDEDIRIEKLMQRPTSSGC